MAVRDGHVRLLPIHVANKIAAGEVVERPASVLKELLENALDAGATRIEAQATAGGRKLVSVRDDGCGMTREDALMSLERQATSKIRDVDDVERIDTFGFRGEAIPSIAAVSRFTLVTRRAADDEALRLVVNAGTLEEISACGAPPGTCVEVRDLFCNVPARRKFLRAYATEEARLKSIFVQTALAHPAVGLALAFDGREIWRLAPNGTLEERIHALFGPEFAQRLVPVTANNAARVRVHGYVERPGAAPAVRHEQYIFTNGRPATAAAISTALKEGYPRHPGDEKPSVVLFVDVPPEDVDVNVHPAKREVRFRHPGEVRDAVLEALAAAFTTATPGRKPPEAAPPPPAPAADPAPPPVHSANDAATLLPVSAPPFVVPFSTAVQPAFDLSSPAPPPQAEKRNAAAETQEPPAPTPPALPLETASGPWNWFRILAMTNSGYLLLETDAGLVTINPTAARERIAYEALLDESRISSQMLLLPETVHLPPLESARLKSFVSVLAAQGFVLDDLGGDDWKIDAIPQLADGVSPGDLLTSIVYDIGETGIRRGSAKWREELVARSIARSWAGASGKLTDDGAAKLVEELAGCRMPYVDPRGKPVMIFTSNNELSRKFSR